jgi:DNA replication protein DnaC
LDPVADADGYYRDAPRGIRNDEADWNQVGAGLRAIIDEATSKRRWPIYLFGECGRGKTSTAAAVYRRWNRGRPGWVRLGEFVRLIQRCEKSGPQYVDGSQYAHGCEHFWRTRIEEPALLVVDDVGLRTVTEPQRELICDLIDRRGTRPTIYTGNLGVKALGELYDARVSSRMLRGIPVELTGIDRRLEFVTIRTVSQEVDA